MLARGQHETRESHSRRGKMTTQGGCNCATELSRRGLLKVGLSAAAVAAMGESRDALAESQAQSKAETKQVLRAAGVRSIDIHAHYYPQSFIDVLNEDGKRFNAEFHMTGQYFSFKAPVG